MSEKEPAFPVEPLNFASEYRPSRSERFWLWLGFRYHLNDLPDTDLPGWMITKSTINFGILDRLRLLVSGRLEMDLRQATDRPVDHAISALSFRIAPPSQRRQP